MIQRVRVLMIFSNERAQLFSSKDEEIADLRMRLADIEQKHAPCSNIIEGLRNEFGAVTVAHAPCGAQIRELSADVVRLDKKLAAEHERAEVQAKQLDEHKYIAAQLETKNAQLVADLSKAVTAHAPCAAKIRELSADVACLDKKLAREQEKAEALAKELMEQ